jgi:hypothetical protein
LRAILLVPLVGDFRARQIGILIGSALIILVACLFIRSLNAFDGKPLMLVGVLWTVLIVAFEFTPGHFVFRRSWSDWASGWADRSFSGGGFRERSSGYRRSAPRW